MQFSHFLLFYCPCIQFVVFITHKVQDKSNCAFRKLFITSSLMLKCNGQKTDCNVLLS